MEDTDVRVPPRSRSKAMATMPASQELAYVGRCHHTGSLPALGHWGMKTNKTETKKEKERSEGYSAG